MSEADKYAANPVAGAPAEDPAAFWNAGPDLGALGQLSVLSDPPLRRLGESPFTRSGFPVLGFLEGLYEQVAAHAHSRLPQKGA